MNPYMRSVEAAMEREFGPKLMPEKMPVVDPLAADETSDGIMAMNTDIQVSESAYWKPTDESNTYNP